MRAVLFRIVFAGFALAISFGYANAIEIKEVTSPGGIKAWLVESKSIPLIAMDFSFEGGSTSDPVGKEGTAHFITGMMDEGAGDLDSAAFQSLRDELAVRINFDSGMDRFEGSLRRFPRTANRPLAFSRKCSPRRISKRRPWSGCASNSCCQTRMMNRTRKQLLHGPG